MEQLNSARYDLVLIPGPPLLVTGEAQTLSTRADAIIVALPDPVRFRTVADLAATLSRLPVRALGFITVRPGPAGGKIRSGRRRPSDRTPDRDFVLPTEATSNANHEQWPSAPRRRWVDPLRSPPGYVDKLRDS